MEAAHHPDQAARLGALRRLEILDTPREAAFDEVVDLAARLCGRPISVINLIDADRQWFKAETGLGVGQTPLETSICAHAILEGDFVEIPDTLADPRMCDNALCLADPGLRFYAGAILRTADGQPIGTLCVLDHEPGALNELQRTALKVLAAQVMAQLELRLALRSEVILRKEIDHRVKNSLQMVAAFARLQRRKVDLAGASALLAIEQQIGAVALLHDVLSHTDDHSEISIDAYMSKLCEVLSGTLPDTLHVKWHFDALDASSATATALGSILNELVTNSVKHSFGTGRSGVITITGCRVDDLYRIVCGDDGTATTVCTAHNGLGKLIMSAAVRQIGGVLTAGAELGGYRSIIDFPAPTGTRR